MLGHRGASHSLLFAAAAGFLAAGLFVRDRAPVSGRFLAVGALASLACASHGLLDALTDAGLGIGFFLPFDDGRYFFDWRPLRTSPLSVMAFVNRRGLEILANEAFYIGLPAALLGGFGLALRRLRARAESTDAAKAPTD